REEVHVVGVLVPTSCWTRTGYHPHVDSSPSERHATGAMRSYWTTRGLPAGVHALVRFAGVIMRRVPMRTAILVAIAAVLVARTAVATTVTNLNDSGDGSLRAAVAATPPGGGVDFAPGLTGTITLASPIDVNGLTISGPGASVLRLSGGGATRLLT